MKKVVLFTLVFTITLAVTAQKTVKSPATPKTETVVMKNLLDSFSYAAGVNVATNMKQQGITGLNSALMYKAIDDIFKNKPLAITAAANNECLQKQLGIFNKAKADAETAVGRAFLEKNKKNKDVVVLPNGLQYIVISQKDTILTKPKLTDTVIVNYIGTFIDGREFDNSYKSGQAAVYPITGFIKGWTEILLQMPVGAKWKVYVPSELAYGSAGGPSGSNIPPNATLVFEMSLEGIKPVAIK